MFGWVGLFLLNVPFCILIFLTSWFSSDILICGNVCSVLHLLQRLQIYKLTAYLFPSTQSKEQISEFDYPFIYAPHN